MKKIMNSSNKGNWYQQHSRMRIIASAGLFIFGMAADVIPWQHVDSKTMVAGFN